MKKGISISLVLLMIAAMLHFSVATHYCGGQFAASKVSLTGKLANCGMESCEMKLAHSGTNFTNNCCDDFVSFCEIDSNYTPSFSFIPDTYQYNFRILCTPAESPVFPSTVLTSVFTSESPPGERMTTCVNLSDICVFRI